MHPVVLGRVGQDKVPTEGTAERVGSGQERYLQQEGRAGLAAAAATAASATAVAAALHGIKLGNALAYGVAQKPRQAICTTKAGDLHNPQTQAATHPRGRPGGAQDATPVLLPPTACCCRHRHRCR